MDTESGILGMTTKSQGWCASRLVVHIQEKANMSFAEVQESPLMNLAEKGKVIKAPLQESQSPCLQVCTCHVE